MTGFRPACRCARSEPDARPTTLCRPRAILAAMCNLYSITKGQQAIRDLAGAMRESAGNMPPLPGAFPDYSASVVPIGSGEIESAHRYIAQLRLKRPGAWWPGFAFPSVPALAPPAPPPVARLCSSAPQLLWQSVTSRVRSSPATAPHLPDTDRRDGKAARPGTRSPDSLSTESLRTCQGL